MTSGSGSEISSGRPISPLSLSPAPSSAVPLTETYDFFAYDSSLDGLADWGCVDAEDAFDSSGSAFCPL